MDLSEKLYSLYLKIIERVEDKSQISERFGCELKEDGETYNISIISSLESFERGNKIYLIKFQNLSATVTDDQYNHIIESVKDKLKHLIGIEEEKEKKRQEIIVDRLLNKFN